MPFGSVPKTQEECGTPFVLDVKAEPVKPALAHVNEGFGFWPKLIYAGAGFILSITFVLFLMFAPPKRLSNTRAAFDSVPDNNHLQSVKIMIDSASKEILLEADDLRSGSVLESLGAATKRGVKVHLLLSASNNKERGTYLWVMKNSPTIDITFSKQFSNQHFMIIDRRYSVLSFVPFSKVDSNTTGTWLILDDPSIANLIVTYFKKRIGQKS